MVISYEECQISLKKWADAPHCPRCGSRNVEVLKEGTIQCKYKLCVENLDIYSQSKEVVTEYHED